MHKIQNLLVAVLLALVTILSCKTDKTDWKHNDNTVRVRIPADVTTLNPYLYRTAYENTVFDLIFQYLVGFDPESLKMSLQLVNALPIVQDVTTGEYVGGQVFTYEIRDAAVWDDGKPVTGYDYAFTLKALFNPKAPTQRWLSYLDYIHDVEVDAGNPKKFTVFTNRKYFLAEAAIGNLAVLPMHIYDPENLLQNIALKDLTDPAKSAAIADNPNLQQFADAFTSPKYSREIVSGSGPYKLVEWVDGQRVVLAKKENWWGDQFADKATMLVARPDTLIFMPIADQTAAVTALKDESVDVALEIDSKQFKELEQDSFVKSIFNLYTPPRFAFFYVAMNNKNPKLGDKRVRRALAHLLDMDMVINDLYDGFGERITGPFLPDKDYYNKDLKPIQMDLDKARQLLAEAGWKDSNGNGILDKTIDGQLVEMKLQYLYTPGSTFQENLTELMKNNARSVGIEIERVQVETNVMGERLRNRDYELAGRGAGSAPVPDDPKQLFHTESDNPGGTNYARFGSAQTDSLIESIRNAPDDAARKELYLQFQEIIYDEQPLIFLFAPKDKIAVHKRFDAIITRKSPGVALAHLRLKEDI